MGYDFYNMRGDEFYLKVKSWMLAFRLAQQYGWIPEGVESPVIDCEVYEVDKMNYVTNDLQIVKKSDARNLADALERALNDISDTELYKESSMRIQKVNSVKGLNEALFDLFNPKEGPLIYFSGSKKKHLVDFIKFCRKGSFEIG